MWHVLVRICLGTKLMFSIMLQTHPKKQSMELDLKEDRASVYKD